MIARARTPIIAIVSVILLTTIAVLFVKENPILVFKVLFQSAFGSAENISYTLYYATPLIMTGTAVSLALSAGLFNIGAEGQLYMGAVFAAMWGIFARPFPALLTWFGAFVFAFIGGFIWGWIAGYLKSKRDTHEVIATIMLNFIALAFANWMILNPLKNPENQSLETIWISEAARIDKLWLQMTPALPIALLICFLVMKLISKTWLGFRIRVTGANDTAAELAGIKTKKTAILAMGLSGGIAGLVGFQEIFCNSYRLIDSFSSGFGFTGLAIALLARGNFTKMIIASLLFGALHKGALDLDLETEKVTRDLSLVIQALILIVLAVLSNSEKRSSK